MIIKDNNLQPENQQFPIEVTLFGMDINITIDNLKKTTISN
jgi:hypothetical protein